MSVRANTHLVLGAAMVAALASSVAAAPAPGSRPTREFIQAAGQSDAFEILEGRTVLAQSGDPQVRAFAQQMIRDHEGTSRTLEQAATQSGLAPPPKGLGEDQAHLLGALHSLSGREFDRAYLRHQVLAHRSALLVEQGYAASGDAPAVRQAAAAAVPIIAAHLAMAEQMHAAAGNP